GRGPPGGAGGRGVRERGAGFEGVGEAYRRGGLRPPPLAWREVNQNALTAAPAISAVASTLAGRRRCRMPDRKTLQRAKRDKREGKSPSTQAGEFVREEMEHIREGKHGARSPQQAIAIGLSKARRAGI